MLCSLVIIAVVQGANSQSFQALDLTKVEVEGLSDQQIQEYLEVLKDRGISQIQAEELARQRGVSEAKISALRRRIALLRSGSNSIGAESGRNGSGSVLRTAPAIDRNPVKQTNESRVFGSDIFRSGNQTFAPNLSLPTPVDYTLGPGDELRIDLWGASQLSLTLPITPEGNVRPENLGPVYLNGLTIEQATEKLVERLSQIYSGLKSDSLNRPSIFYQVSLGQIRTINVELIGAVQSPGSYSLPSLANVYTALQAAGGPNNSGTFRNIKVIRNNKLLTTIDVYDYLLEGVKTGNVNLKNGDVILVPNLDIQVDLIGEFRRPGLFELNKDETMEDLLIFAGGFNSGAYRKSLTIKRNGQDQKYIIDLARDDFETFSMQDGDIIEVGRILQKFENRVIIKGAVMRQGEFELTSSLSLKMLINKADGLRGDAFMERATIYRTNEDFSQSTIPVNLNALINGTISDIPLVREDVIKVPSIYELREEYFVQISGEVLEGGIYPFFQGMTVEDLVVLSGGLKESASSTLIEISRRNKSGGVNSMAEIISISIDNNLSPSKENRESVLQPFDQVYVRKSPGYTVQERVALEGEVLTPGEYTIQKKDERISDLLERANGLTPYAYPKGTILIRKTEFSNSRSEQDINQALLRELRQKILSDKSELKSSNQIELINRIEKIESKSSIDNGNDLLGSRIKKNLIEDISEQDSLIRDIDIVEQEPVAIDLDLILKSPGSKYDLIVRPGDVISIPRTLETVRLAGEVTSPLNLRYDASYSFKDYIRQSGGFLQSAKRGSSYIQYPNGERKGVKRFLWFKTYPRVEPGSTIFISRKPERQSLNFQAIIAAAGSVATLALVIDRLSSN